MSVIEAYQSEEDFKIFSARVETPCVQRLHRSSCASEERVTVQVAGPNSQEQTQTNTQTTNTPNKPQKSINTCITQKRSEFQLPPQGSSEIPSVQSLGCDMSLLEVQRTVGAFAWQTCRCELLSRASVVRIEGAFRRCFSLSGGPRMCRLRGESLCGSCSLEEITP